MFLCDFMFSLPLGLLCIGVELLGHMVTLCIQFEELTDYLAKWLYHFTLLPAVPEVSKFSTLTNTYYLTVVLDILVGVDLIIVVFLYI